MNFDRYVNRVSRPLRSTFSEEVEVVTKNGVKKTVHIFDNGRYQEALNAYRNEVDRITEQFFKDLLEELNLTNHPKASVLREKAWEYGHDDGFESVANWAYSLAELLS